MRHRLNWKARLGVHFLLFAVVASTLVPASFADGEKRLLVDNVSYEPSTQQVTVNVDILGPNGEPMDKVEAGDLEFLLNGKPVTLSDVQVETADKANEPVAVCILLNASNSYQLQTGEQHSAYQSQKEGAAGLIKLLKGNDKVAVLQYHNSNSHQPISTWSSNFAAAVTSVESATGPAAEEEGNAQIQGAQKAERSLHPQFLDALDKGLAYMTDNAEKLSQTRRKYLIVMSDGKDRQTDMAKIETKRKAILEKYSDQNIRILSIAFFPDEKKYGAVLQSTANDTNGFYKKVDELVQVPPTWDAMGKRIKKQFIVQAKLAELPDWGEPVKGKDELKYNITVKAKLKDGATEEGVFNDLRLPAPSLPWKKWLKWAGIGLGALLGIGLIIGLIVFLSRRKGNAPAPVTDNGSSKPDGPHRGRVAVIAGPMAGSEFYLVDDVTTIGRIKGNTIVIPDPSVSSRHAALKIDQMRYEIADLNSQNKVLVNGQQVNKVYLKDGDRVKLGDTEFQFWLK